MVDTFFISQTIFKDHDASKYKSINTFEIQLVFDNEFLNIAIYELYDETNNQLNAVLSLSKTHTCYIVMFQDD